MSDFQCFCLFLFFLGIIAVPLFVTALLTCDWNRGERVEEALKYDPDPAYPVTRFCTPEEMRKGGW